MQELPHRYFTLARQAQSVFAVRERPFLRCRYSSFARRIARARVRSAASGASAACLTCLRPCAQEWMVLGARASRGPALSPGVARKEWHRCCGFGMRRSEACDRVGRWGRTKEAETHHATRADGLTSRMRNQHRRGKSLPHHTAMHMHKYPETVATPAAPRQSYFGQNDSVQRGTLVGADCWAQSPRDWATESSFLQGDQKGTAISQ